jgi:hypothetical protein
MIGIDDRFGRGGVASGIIQIQAHILVQSALVSFQGQHIVATLFHNLFGDRALAIQRIDGHNCPLQRQHFQQLRYGGNLVRFLVGGDLRQNQASLAAPGALTMCKADLPLARSNERRNSFPSIAITSR